MKFSCTKRIGDEAWVFEGEAPSQKALFKAGAFLGSLPKVCGHCKSTDINFEHRTPKGYEYYLFKCGACSHELQFGQYQDGSGLFCKDWQPPYVATGGNVGEQHQGQGQVNPVPGAAPPPGGFSNNTVEDVPF